MIELGKEKISNSWRIVLPDEARRLLNLNKNDEGFIYYRKGEIVIRKEIAYP